MEQALPQNFDLVIEPGRAARHYWSDLWRYRELFYFMAWRDIAVRYKQTAIGISWAVIQPLATIVILSFVFGRVANLDSGSVPYPLLVAAGTLPWQFFATALGSCSSSLITNSNMLTKVYFPRLVIPASAIIVALVDFVVSFVLFLLIMAWYGHVPTWKIVLLPGFMFIAFLFSFGFGLWIATLNVEYRDFRYIVPFIIQFGVYVSPVGFSTDILYEKLGSWSYLVALNPMVGVIDGFRWALLGNDQHIYMPAFLLSMGIVVLLVVTGLWYFRRMERTFADVI